ncbi:hypothetical protein [Aquaspirillum serpens]|uniref:hypothetical protein n=1 Tax=Aquaspirillum serpens TaxID=190 RepID=UPI0003B4ABEA|nr:hypothetical protein [Aquaspirillum serpens]
MSICTGYHGTSEENAKSIVATKFRLSQEGDEYLGTGVYFFVDGICCPITAGKRWAVSKHSDAPSVVRADIQLSGSNILDLREVEHIKKFNELKKNFFEKLEKEGIFLVTFPNKRRKWDDKCKIANFIINYAAIDLVIKDEYFPEVGSDIERAQGIQLKVSNCTIMNVANESKILSTSLLHWG